MRCDYVPGLRGTSTDASSGPQLIVVDSGWGVYLAPAWSGAIRGGPHSYGSHANAVTVNHATRQSGRVQKCAPFSSGESPWSVTINGGGRIRDVLFHQSGCNCRHNCQTFSQPRRFITGGPGTCTNGDGAANGECCARLCRGLLEQSQYAERGCENQYSATRVSIVHGVHCPSL